MLKTIKNKKYMVIRCLVETIIELLLLFYDDADFYIKDAENRLLKKLPKGNALYRIVKEKILKPVFNEDIPVSLIKALLDELAVEERIHFDKADFGKNSKYLNFRNGVVDLDTAQMLEEEDSTNMLFDYVLDCNYLGGVPKEPSAIPSSLLQLLAEPMDINVNEVTPDDSKKITSVLEAIGYLLSDGQKERKAVFFIGASASGKSTLAKFVASIISPSCMVTYYTLMQMVEGFSSLSAVSAKLNAADETDVSSKNSLEFFKSIVSGGEIEARRKYADNVSVLIRTKLLFCCNTLPDFHGMQAEAIMDRMILVVFSNTVENRDPNLRDKLWQERNEIITCAVQAYAAARKRGNFSRTALAEDLLHLYCTQQNSEHDFVSECLVIDPDAKIASADLWEQYKEYCKANAIVSTMSRTRLYQTIIQKCGTKVQQKKIRHPIDGRSVQGFTGIRLKA